MWSTLLSACIISCFWRLGSTLLVEENERKAFNRAVRRPMLEQVGQELRTIKSSVENPNIADDINKCKMDISSKYYKCAQCLNVKYKERNPRKVLSVGNALMSLCSYTNVDYKICQVILDHEQPFLEFIERATKRVQGQFLSVIDPAKDAGPMLDIFQNLMSGQWASSSAADVRKAVNDAKLALQTQPKPQSPQGMFGQRIKRSDKTDSEHLRLKRWTEIVKSMMAQIPKMAKGASKKYANKDYMSYMQKYMEMGKGFKMPRIKRSSARKGHLRTKRWLQMVQNILKGMNVQNTSSIMNVMGNIQSHVPAMPTRMFGGRGNSSTTKSETLKCDNNMKCNSLVSACASSSCPDPTKHMIIDVCGYHVLPKANDITSRLTRTKDIFDAVRTKQDFISKIEYHLRRMAGYQNLRMTANVGNPTVINLPSMTMMRHMIPQAARNAAPAIMSRLRLQNNQTPI